MPVTVKAVDAEIRKIEVELVLLKRARVHLKQVEDEIEYQQHLGRKALKTNKSKGGGAAAGSGPTHTGGR